MFVGWEGVGLASYLLIGFWFLKHSATNAGKKAFITNRVGDFGFLIALFLIVKHFGTLQFGELYSQSGSSLYGDGRGCANRHRRTDVCRRNRQVGADSAVCVAARCDGRPDACVGADSRRHHGHRRRLHGGALEPDSSTERRSHWRR